MSEPSFATLYRRFLALISQPNPLARAASERAALDPGSAVLSEWVNAANDERAAERLGIYAHMYFARLAESLRDDYAACAGVVGLEAFDSVAARYLVAHPSDNPSLRHHGRHFARFLREREGELAQEHPSFRTDLADLAALEWARIEVFDAPPAPLLEASTVASTPAESWLHLEVRLIPACRMVPVRHDIEGLWLAAARGPELPARRERERTLLVWRRGFGVFHRAVEAPESHSLSLLERGISLSQLCAAVGRERPTEVAAAMVFALLRQWLADEILTAGHAATSPAS